jgi:hypothetical protein
MKSCCYTVELNISPFKALKTNCMIEVALAKIYNCLLAGLNSLPLFWFIFNLTGKYVNRIPAISEAKCWKVKILSLQQFLTGLLIVRPLKRAMNWLHLEIQLSKT